ncbi:MULTISPECIES: hypothetical protein [Bacillus]|uniref:hypothetical protein n=1 Tax=Bacillus TaxID=1386 RepID=UPI000518C16F|nr:MULTISPECIES: hypothetical protein [Bacillus]MDK4253244.1 hypothetical protein [Bacillus velezensis]QHK07145.1 hypothetical protein C7M19_02106 [Bacillus velezensis]QHK12668.1 hypothetical protein C7M20_03824 [Bacillus velezensis]QHK13564.1 hypothetical protein C7M21_00801 [Bacillus velezensis]QHK63419.1 hypothetical protein C7M22_01293 [Bacillus velezensis]
MKIQHKKEIAFYCYAIVPMGFVIYTVISILFQDITFPLTVRNVLHESLRNLGSLILFSLFFYPSYIWMKKEFGSRKEAERRG